MSRCDEVLDRLDDAVAGTLAADLAQHVASCPTCQQAVIAARGAANGTRPVVPGAPAGLVARIKRMPRFAPACEAAQAALQRALDGESEPSDRAALMAHVHACPTCRSTWEAYATLREVGGLTHATPRLRSAVRLHPSHNVTVRGRRRRFVDLRLATAAAYLFAALTVALAGNPTTLAREGTARVEKASFYARAAVTNRLEALAGRAKDVAAASLGWVEDRAHDGWNTVRRLFTHPDENPPSTTRVVPGENGGSQ